MFDHSIHWPLRWSFRYPLESPYSNWSETEDLWASNPQMLSALRGWLHRWALAASLAAYSDLDCSQGRRQGQRARSLQSFHLGNCSDLAQGSKSLQRFKDCWVQSRHLGAPFSLPQPIYSLDWVSKLPCRQILAHWQAVSFQPNLPSGSWLFSVCLLCHLSSD